MDLNFEKIEPRRINLTYQNLSDAPYDEEEMEPRKVDLTYQNLSDALYDDNIYLFLSGLDATTLEDLLRNVVEGSPNKSITEAYIKTFRKKLQINFVLYRVVDKNGDLLYVGQTDDPIRRLKNHSTEKDWWENVHSVSYEHFSSKDALNTAEITAINT